METLISYTGRDPVEVDLGTAEKRARLAGKPFARATQGATLYLRPGTTAMLSGDELEALRAVGPAVMRFVHVHVASAAAPIPAGSVRRGPGPVESVEPSGAPSGAPVAASVPPPVPVVTHGTGKGGKKGKG